MRPSQSSVLLLVMTVVLVACEQPSASQEQCQAIFDRIVAIEVAEMGFADPALTTRTQDALRLRFRNSLSQCVGRPLPSGAMDCVTRASSAEELSHRCLH